MNHETQQSNPLIRQLDRKRYEQPNPIPNGLAGVENVRPEPDAGTRAGVEKVVALARDNIVLPALAQQSEDEYISFLVEHHVRFSSILQTLSELSETSDKLTGCAPPPIEERRNWFFAGCIDSARRLSDDGAAHVRRIMADTLAAYAIVNGLESRATLDDPEDVKNASRYNNAMRFLDSLLVCLWESKGVEVAPALRASVVGLPMGMASILYDCACQAAKARNVPIEFDESLLYVVWSQPTRDLADYLEDRAPHLLTDDLRKSCASFDELDGLIARASSGEPFDEQSSACAETSHDDVDIDAWANSLAEQLASLHD